MNIELSPGYTRSGRAVIWENTHNPHLYLSGQSGTGKSFLLKKLVIQAAEQGALVLVLDYTGDFRDYTPANELHFQRIDVTSPAFALNPLAGLPGQSSDARTQQLLAALHSVFRMGPRATVSLRHATTDYLAATGNPTLAGLLNRIYEIKDAGCGLEAAKEPLELLTSLVHCKQQPISLDTDSPGLTIVDLTNIYNQNLCRLLVELTLQMLWLTHTPKQPPLILVLDEAQRLNWGQGSMAARILREGRKFGIGGWFASQWIGNKEAAAALNQAALQAHFQPDGQHVDKLAKAICSTHPSNLLRCRKIIQGLHRGQFLWQQPNGNGNPVIVTVLP